MPRPPVTSLLDHANAVAPLTLSPPALPSAVLPVPPPVPLSEATTSDVLGTAMLRISDDEWRPLTVLACQLVGVSGHAAPGDREARLAIVRDCHVMWTEVMQRFGGYLAQSQGGRLLI